MSGVDFRDSDTSHDPRKTVKEGSGRRGWEEEWQITLCGDCGKLLLNNWVEPGNSCRTQVSIDLGCGTRLTGVQIPAPLISSCARLFFSSLFYKMRITTLSTVGLW